MTDLITVYDEIMVLMDEWRMVGVVYSDLSKALNFPTKPHKQIDEV